MSKHLSKSFLLASLMAFAGVASAQNAAPATAKGDGTDNKVKAEAMATPSTAAAVSDKTRADVKAEAKAANKTGVKNKSGEGQDLASKPYPAGDMKTRADVKAEAKAQNKSGMNKEGKVAAEVGKVEAGAMNARADVKADAKAANKAQN